MEGSASLESGFVEVGYLRLVAILFGLTPLLLIVLYFYHSPNSLKVNGVLHTNNVPAY